MKVEKVLKNIKSQRGATGADIIVAVTIIVLTIAVVSMIYVNTTLGSRNVTRTAGATRIATNILENIEKLSYDEFITDYKEQVEDVGTIQTTGEFTDYYAVDGGSGASVFSTKIPKGYKLYLKAAPNYGTHTNEKEKFDLVREINLVLTFNVGDVTEKVEFETAKTREIIGETNSPSTEYLTSSGILQSGMQYYPVKYLENSKSYIKVDEDDSSWYNYSNKQWATVIVSKKDESEIFDINGKFVGEINTTKTDSEYTEKFVWIPRFFTKTINGTTDFYAFAYLGEGTNKIVSVEIPAKSTEATLTLNTFAVLEATEGANTETTNFEGKTGRWVSCENNGIINDEDANILNNSKYGKYLSY